MEKHESRSGGGQGHDQAAEDIVTAEDAAGERYEAGVQGVEGGGAARDVVAVLGDPDEPVAVPARPHIGQPAEIVDQRRVVPVDGVDVAVREECEQREYCAHPDGGPAPEEDPQGLAARHHGASIGPDATVTR